MSATVPGPMEHPRNREELQQYLENAFGFDSSHVVFQGDPQKMKYPAWRYRLSDMDEDFADNGHYRTSTCYEITHISVDPDSRYLPTMRQMPYCRFVRHYVSNGLNHWVFRFWTLL